MSCPLCGDQGHYEECPRSETIILRITRGDADFLQGLLRSWQDWLGDYASGDGCAARINTQVNRAILRHEGVSSRETEQS